MGLPQTFGIDHDADIDWERAGFFVEIQVDRHHFANFQPLELYRCIHLQAAQGLVETQCQELRLAIGRGEGGRLVLEQLIVPIFCGALVAGAIVRGAEGNATEQHG
ncbi:hypothetical protein D3C85_599740 [compost metagenome]